ncbi:MAG: type II toxin-antitoxin system RatA family toxin [Alphaproteobacteria bacterium]|nr:MAG: type II toxin-antitoxin system RatA family toxin [Alphaproteobacteria bacterium]
MPTRREKRKVPYSADQMFDLIADVERYPEFLPWCSATRTRSRHREGDVEIMDSEMVVSFKAFRERFGTRVTMRRKEKRIEVAYLDGPFRYLINHWQFHPLEDGGCEIEFFVDFEFRSAVLQALIGVVFNEAMRRIVRAFEERAAALYGPGAQEGQPA